MRDLLTAILCAVDTPTDIAETVADHLVCAQLTGYDSHGPIQIPGYLRQVEAGTISPRARPRTAASLGAVVRLDGDRGWGHYAARQAMALALDRAQHHGIGAASLFNCSHIGRLGTYAEQAAAQSMIGLITFGEGQPGHYLAVPYGSRHGALSTNPIAAGVPTASTDPFLMDFATTKIANARTWVYQEQGRSLPEGVALDAAGNPTTDPGAYQNGGHLIIFGEHKGYALSLLTCLLGALSGGLNPDTAYLGGSFFLAVNPAAFLEQTAYADGVSGFLDALRRLPPAAGHRAVLVPGDPEMASRHQRAGGIPISAALRQALISECDQLGVPHALG